MPKKIIVADDEPTIVELIEVALSLKSDYEVKSVSNGSQLPNMLTKEKPDLLILDVLLPGIDGYSLQMRFAQEEQFKHIPVIVLTALPASRSLFEKFSQVKYFISKPFDATDLLEKVESILGK